MGNVDRLLAIAGLSGEVAIVGTGCFVAFYSTLGGVRAVVFTDVVQAFILLVRIVPISFSLFR
jgi:Na+/pantothenate symporter